MRPHGFHSLGGLEGDPGSLEEVLAEPLAHWMVAGWLAEVQAVGGRCWLGGWLATGTPGAEGHQSGEGKPFVWGARTTTFIKKPITIPTVD